MRIQDFNEAKTDKGVGTLSRDDFVNKITIIITKWISDSNAVNNRNLILPTVLKEVRSAFKSTPNGLAVAAFNIMSNIESILAKDASPEAINFIKASKDFKKHPNENPNGLYWVFGAYILKTIPKNDINLNTSGESDKWTNIITNIILGVIKEHPEYSFNDWKIEGPGLISVDPMIKYYTKFLEALKENKIPVFRAKYKIPNGTIIAMFTKNYRSIESIDKSLINNFINWAKKLP